MIVLHDLNLPCRYTDHVVAIKDGRIFAEGAPDDVIDAETVRAVFGVDCEVVADPVSGTPLVVPCGRHDQPRAATVTSAPAVSSRG